MIKSNLLSLFKSKSWGKLKVSWLMAVPKLFSIGWTGAAKTAFPEVPVFSKKSKFPLSRATIISLSPSLSKSPKVGIERKPRFKLFKFKVGKLKEEGNNKSLLTCLMGHYHHIQLQWQYLAIGNGRLEDALTIFCLQYVKPVMTYLLPVCCLAI